MDREAAKKRDDFKLECKLSEELLHIRLDVLEEGKVSKRFMTVLDDASLPSDVKKNFANIKNVNSFLENTESCEFDLIEGKITLVYNVTFPNGFASTLTGLIQLVEQQITDEPSIHQHSAPEIKEIVGEVAQLKSGLEALRKEMDSWREEERREGVKEDVVDLKKKVSGLQQQEGGSKERARTNLMIQTQIEDMHNKLQQQKAFFLDIIEELKESNKALREEFKQSSQRILKVEEQNIKLKQSFQVFALTLKESEKEQEKLREEIKSMKQEAPEIKNDSGVSGFMENSQMLEKVPMPLHKGSPYLNDFIRGEDFIIFNGLNQITQLLGADPITDNFKCYLTICQTNLSQIGIGILDITYLKERNSMKKPNYIMYYSWNGGIFSKGQCLKTEGAGFKKGQTVKMIVKPKQGKVQWSVEGIVEAQFEDPRIKDQAIQWVPFIRMGEAGDKVKWLMQA